MPKKPSGPNHRPNQYRLEIVTNRLGVAWLRLKAPRGAEIIMAGELRSDLRGATITAENIAKSVEARGLRIVEVYEGPRTFDEPHGEATQ